jgi:hypothetical protein
MKIINVLCITEHTKELGWNTVEFLYVQPGLNLHDRNLNFNSLQL